jgi:hypothetical protein
MSNQQFRSIPLQYRLAVGLSLFALFLFVAIIAGLLAPRGDYITAYRNILASIAVLIGLLGLLIYVARLRGWLLPAFLQIPEEKRDEHWRLLAMSLFAIAIPILVILTQSLISH